MELDRRGGGILPVGADNPRGEDRHGSGEAVWHWHERLDAGSRMNREVPVRFCEGLGVKFPRATHPRGGSVKNVGVHAAAR